MGCFLAIDHSKIFLSEKNIYQLPWVVQGLNYLSLHNPMAPTAVNTLHLTKILILK